MIAFYILLLVLALVFIAGSAMLYYACGRRRVDDMWDKALVEKHGYGMLWEGIEAGRNWLLAQDCQPLELMSFDGRLLRGTLVPCPGARGTILLFHGWRSSWKLDFSSIIQHFNSLGLNIILIDERAHGTSQGLFISFGVKERRDVLSWVTYAGQLYGEGHPIFIDGVSMGAASVLMASDFDFPANLRGIMADSAFISPYDIMSCVMVKLGPAFPRRAALWLLNIFTKIFAGFGLKEYSTLKALENTVYPVLLIHGTADSFVPCEMSRRNYAACASKKELLCVEGADHALSYHVDKPRVQKAADDFIERNII